MSEEKPPYGVQALPTRGDPQFKTWADGWLAQPFVFNQDSGYKYPTAAEVESLTNGDVRLALHNAMVERAHKVAAVSGSMDHVLDLQKEVRILCCSIMAMSDWMYRDTADFLTSTEVPDEKRFSPNFQHDLAVMRAGFAIARELLKNEPRG